MKTFHLKITLDDSKPKIWRSVKINGNATLESLHHTIQIAMGWYNCHLHQFVIKGETYGVNYDDDWGEPLIDESKTIISKVLDNGEGFTYQYDFGDGWDHSVTVTEITDENILYPTCTAGKRNCPPEDIGGIWGYESFVEIMQNPKHPEYEEYLEWHDGPYDPELFEIDEVNKSLAKNFAG